MSTDREYRVTNGQTDEQGESNIQTPKFRMRGHNKQVVNLLQISLFLKWYIFLRCNFVKVYTF